MSTVRLVRHRAPRPDAPAVVVPPPPLGVYVHLPWCLRKCPYCDFNSHEVRGEVDEARYLDALAADLEQALPGVWGRTVQSIFIGGGTPSLFSPGSIDRLLTLLRTCLRVAPDAEITLEANPGAADHARFAGFASAGVNRLSIGVQSFDDRALAAIGRIHDGADALRAIDAASRYVGNVNLDLMFGLPTQSIASCEADLNRAIEMGSSHLSFYQMTIEPQTAFAKRPPPLPDEDTTAHMQALVEDRLASAGYDRYEVSAYARPGRRCRHNLNYWRFGDYLGLGAGAHGKLSLPDGIVREQRWRQPARYMQAALAADAVESRHRVVAAELPFEFMLNALRLREGVEAGLFAATTGLGVEVIADRLSRLARDGLLEPDPLRLRATELGWRFLSDLQAHFLLDDPCASAPN